jgi:EKC/KEOPS complex subunit CGI121/TPRKB
LAAELVYSLSPTRNISESLITFGVGGENKNLIVATFGDQNGKQMSKIGKHIEGTPVSMDTLKEVVDLATIKRVNF